MKFKKTKIKEYSFVYYDRNGKIQRQFLMNEVLLILILFPAIPLIVLFDALLGVFRDTKLIEKKDYLKKQIEEIENDG